MMLPMVLPLPRTSASLGTGPECFFAQAGSPSIASGRRVGALPSNVTVPVMEEAASAAPGQNDTAASAVASHTLFPVARIESAPWVLQPWYDVVSDDAASVRS